MPPFQRLSAWRRAHALALYVNAIAHRATGAPGAIVMDRMCRCALALPERIAAGTARASAREFAGELQAALATTRGLVALAMIALDLEAISRSEFARLDARADEVWRIVAALRRKLEASPVRHPPSPEAPRSTTRRLRWARPGPCPPPYQGPAG